MASINEIQLQEILTVAHHDYEKRLNSHAFFKLNDRALGEDLVQSTYLKTWTYLIKNGRIDMMKAFLYRILNNLIVDEYRKRKTTSLDVLMAEGFDASTGDYKRIFDFLDGKRAFQLIRKLPILYRNAMRMRYVKDLSLKEMSILTGQTKNTLAVQLHRGMEMLKALYAHKT